MIKRTLYFGNPAYLSVKNSQLVIKLPEVETSNVPDSMKKQAERTVPIEDIGVVILDNNRICCTHSVFQLLLDNNCAVITCDANHMPAGLLLPLAGNTTQSERFQHQISASVPLKKQLWQQTIIAKIQNQQIVLRQCCNDEARQMEFWAKQVNSGDTQNIEARAAAYYWKTLFSAVNGFTRHREGIYPNNLLNYGYALLRAIIARSLVASGMLPTLGIHHHNRYNAYCLADDIMEPFRPMVDKLVFTLVEQGKGLDVLDNNIKAELLQIPVLDVTINGKLSPLMIAAGLSAASLYKCYSGESRKISYPELV